MLLHGQKYAENCGSEALNCGLEVADLNFRNSEKIAIAELRSCCCGETFPQKVAELRLRKCFLQVAELHLRTKKKVARARLLVYSVLEGGRDLLNTRHFLFSCAIWRPPPTSCFLASMVGT
jgi:hypothetical protein